MPFIKLLTRVAGPVFALPAAEVRGCGMRMPWHPGMSPPGPSLSPTAPQFQNSGVVVLCRLLCLLFLVNFDEADAKESFRGIVPGDTAGEVDAIMMTK